MLRAYTAYDYSAPAADCPRLTQTRVWVQNWTGANSIPGEVTTQFAVDNDGGHRLTAPDGTVYKEYYVNAANFRYGLTTETRSYATVADANSDSDQNPTWKKKTATSWTQDNEGVNYQLNPRVSETNIYDAAGHRRRTGIGYYSSYGLPMTVTEYAADGQTPLRFTQHLYKLQSAFTVDVRDPHLYKRGHVHVEL